MDESPETMRWMVGVDARELSLGAVAFARWLRGGRFNEIYGVHVVEWLPHDQARMAEVEPDEIRQRAHEALRPLHDDACFEELGAVVSSAADHGLVEAVRAKHAHALVLGRLAPRGGGGLVRLGRVARRLLRALPVPTVVVPPDLTADALGQGPVVLGVDLTDSCGEAATFAARVAAAMGRGLVLVHAVHPPDSGPYMPPELWQLGLDQQRRRGEEDFVAWADRHGVGATERVIEDGPPVRVLIEVARQRDACLVVTGSRKLGGVERLFLSSLGSELAASAPLPVAVVPPH